MISKITGILGIDKRSKYVEKYFFTVNMHASIYMSLVVIAMETFLAILRYMDLADDGMERNAQYYFDNYGSYGIPFAASLIILIIAIIYAAGVKVPIVLGSLCIWIFSAACLYFGMKTSYDDFHSDGGGILTFLTMEIFIMCLLTWRPLIGLCIMLGTYGLFLYSIDGINTLSIMTLTNIAIMGFATLLFVFSNYSKTRNQAMKDERLETVNNYLSKAAVSDELTGLNNMSYFRNAADGMLANEAFSKSDKLFLFYDIVNFKSYNNSYGYEKGSELLKEFAGKILEEYAGDLVARYSDDHFVVFAKAADCRFKTLKLSEELHKLQGEAHLELKCGAYRPDDRDRDTSVACDKARFAAISIKKKYGEMYYEYDKKMADKFSLSQYVVNNIDAAILGGFIKVYYQPVVSTATGGLCGLEALARWQDPEYGLLPPGMFIETLEEYRQIHKLDRCIVEQVCKDYRYSVDNKIPFVPVSLNFSRLDFELCDMTGFLEEMRLKYRVDKRYLEVEITESALTDTQDYLHENMEKLREMDYNLWLDDFGSGYSSLNVLKDYHFDVLKIDMVFLKGFGENPNTNTIIKVIVDMTKQLGMISLCEGVETKEQYEFLASIGCNRTQGYYFSKPAPLEKIRELIDSGKITISPEFAEPIVENKSKAQELIENHRLEGIMNEKELVETVNVELVSAMIKDINRSRSIQDIAKRHKIPVQLSEAICRMYLTHPGCSAEDVMEKLGL